MAANKQTNKTNLTATSDHHWCTYDQAHQRRCVHTLLHRTHTHRRVGQWDSSDIRALTTKPDHLSSIPKSTKWKERTNSPKLSSNSSVHAYTYKDIKCKKREGKKTKKENCKGHGVRRLEEPRPRVDFAFAYSIHGKSLNFLSLLFPV